MSEHATPWSRTRAFVWEHAALLALPPCWTLLVTAPRRIADDAACHAAFARAIAALTPTTQLDAAFRWFVETRRRIEGQPGTLFVADVQRFRECRARWQHTQHRAYTSLARLDRVTRSERG